MLVSPVQSQNATPPMLVTLSGIVMLISPVQPSNAETPMSVTLSGIVMLVSPVQPLNAPSPILVTLSGMSVFLHPEISVLVAVSMIPLQLFLLSYFLFPPETVMLSARCSRRTHNYRCSSRCLES